LAYLSTNLLVSIVARRVKKVYNGGHEHD
jgi:hypothetical protein